MLALSFEFNICLGFTSTILTPIIGKLEEPIPLCVIWAFSIIGLYTIFKIGPRNESAMKMNDSVDQSLLSIIKDNNDSAVSFKGNLSSILINDKLVKKRILKQWQIKTNRTLDQDDSYQEMATL